MKLHTDASVGEFYGGIGWVITLDDGTKIEGNRTMSDSYTSMEMEYFSLLEGLRHAKRYDRAEIEVFSDCKPLIEKMRVPDDDDDWYKRRRGCHRLLNKFESWELEWTPRTSNTNADRLAYEALEAGRQA